QCWQYMEREKGKLQVDPEFDQLVTEMNGNGLKVILDLDPKGIRFTGAGSWTGSKRAFVRSAIPTTTLRDGLGRATKCGRPICAMSNLPSGTSKDAWRCTASGQIGPIGWTSTAPYSISYEESIPTCLSGEGSLPEADHRQRGNSRQAT